MAPLWPYMLPSWLAGCLPGCLAGCLAAWLPGWLPLRPPSRPPAPPGRPPKLARCRFGPFSFLKSIAKRAPQKKIWPRGGPGAPQMTPKSTPNIMQKIHKFPIKSLKKTLPEPPPMITSKTQLFTINPLQYSIFHVFKSLFNRWMFI